ncbi:PEP-CTERM sorting domain-containing protein [Haloferula sp.]|uniref:PEP-CTERM sorting domain-containing protein n=1 Tax=Haloferula sp. TaxID=2497595 RepID=UPI003C74D120
MKLPVISFLAVVAIQASDATVIAVDINSSENPTATQTDFAALVVGRNDGAGSLTTGGILFTVVGGAGSRDRSGPNNLTRDTAFPATAAGSQIGVTFGGAGDLPAGEWKLEVWSHDNDGGTPVGDLLVGVTIGGIEQTPVSATSGGDIDPPAAVVMFTSDGSSAYGLYVEEDNTNNRARLNGFRLTLVPEPSVALLSGLGVLALFRRRR